MSRIRVLVVEDSLVFRELLVQNLNQNPDIEVVAVAGDPFEARDAIVEHQPDVMTLDVELPRMNGIDFLRKLMPQYPLPVVVISALSGKVFDALNAGAVDFVEKPRVTDRSQLEEFCKKELPGKIRIAAAAQIRGIKKKQTEIVRPAVSVNNKNIVVAIGASTGGTEATAAILRELDRDIPGVVVVQHMPPGFTKMYAERLDHECRVTVKEAQSGDMILPGQVLIAPGGDAHMHVVKAKGGYHVAIRRGEKVNGHCPSVDVLFESVAASVGKQALGIILTGMGGDGAKGLLSMRKTGARTIGQDESTCVVYGMPKVAHELGAVEFQEKLSDIARKMYKLINTYK